MDFRTEMNRYRFFVKTAVLSTGFDGVGCCSLANVEGYKAQSGLTAAMKAVASLLPGMATRMNKFACA